MIQERRSKYQHKQEFGEKLILDFINDCRGCSISVETVIAGTVATKRAKILKGVCANKYEKNDQNPYPRGNESQQRFTIASVRVALIKGTNNNKCW